MRVRPAAGLLVALAFGSLVACGGSGTHATAQPTKRASATAPATGRSGLVRVDGDGFTVWMPATPLRNVVKLPDIGHVHNARMVQYAAQVGDDDMVALDVSPFPGDRALDISGAQDGSAHAVSPNEYMDAPTKIRGYPARLSRSRVTNSIDLNIHVGDELFTLSYVRLDGPPLTGTPAIFTRVLATLRFDGPTGS